MARVALAPVDHLQQSRHYDQGTFRIREFTWHTRVYFTELPGMIPVAREYVGPAGMDRTDAAHEFCRLHGVDPQTARFRLLAQEPGGVKVEIKLEIPACAPLAPAPCPGCDGKGHFELLISGRQQCDRCGGSGRLSPAISITDGYSSVASVVDVHRPWRA